MPSSFGHVSETVAKEVGCKETRPVKYLSSANKFHLFSILRKKSSALLKRRSEYVPLGFTLLDILQPSLSVPVTGGFKPLPYVVIYNPNISVSVNVGAEVSASGECSEDHEYSLDYQIVSISSPNLEDLLKRKLVDPEPQYLSECRDRNDKLYVVTQTIEVVKDTVLYNSNNAFNIVLSGFSPQSQGEGQYLKKSVKKLSLQTGMVMAYKMKQLIINPSTFSILSTSYGSQLTFQDRELPKFRFLRKTVSFEVQVGATGQKWVSKRQKRGTIFSRLGFDFGDLQNEVSSKTDALSGLSKNIQHVVFHSVLAMLRDQRALENLEDMLESDSLCHLDDPLCNILNELQQNSSPAEHAILGLLEGIIELSDIQHYFLALSMEKRIMGHQRELARSILEHHFEYLEVVTFTLNPELLAPLQEEDVAITCGLLEECGLKIEPNSRRYHWDPSAKMSLSILYGVLSLLQELAEASALQLPGLLPGYA
uniref:Gasdermin pore forming domain-containing protein n=1 Tax=Otolemur garnettii TaxID=30611 RepID=H0WK18_OTOGA